MATPNALRTLTRIADLTNRFSHDELSAEESHPPLMEKLSEARMALESAHAYLAGLRGDANLPDFLKHRP